MKYRKSVFILAAMLCVSFSAADSWSAMQIRKRAPKSTSAKPAAKPAVKPAKKKPIRKITAKPAAKPTAKPAAKKTVAPKKAPPKAPPKPATKAVTTKSFVGTVKFIRGKNLLIEFEEQAEVKQRFSVYDVRLRKQGSVQVLKALDGNIFLCKILKGSADVGDRLAGESEAEAYYRIMKRRRVSGYREFLQVFPGSSHAAKVEGLLFRQTLRKGFQTFPGASITGKLELQEKLGQEIGFGGVRILLDRFIIAQATADGSFSIEGIPPLYKGVTVKLAVIDDRFKTAKKIEVTLPAKSTAAITMDIPIKLTPTYVSGRVVDEYGNPVRGAMIWTSPYTTEKLTDENGEYRISRKKKLDSSGVPLEGDEPLMGRDYEVYAYKSGFSAEMRRVSAKSFSENVVDTVGLNRQDALGSEGLPKPEVSLADNLELMQFVVSTGAGPKINR
jgi:hypothetical protein